MKKGLWVVIVAVVIMITGNSCKSRKDSCAAYNKVELQQTK